MSRARKGYCAQCCGYLDFTYQHTDSPCVMTTEVLDIRSGFSLMWFIKKIIKKMHVCRYVGLTPRVSLTKPHVSCTKYLDWKSTLFATNTLPSRSLSKFCYSSGLTDQTS